MSEIIFKSLSEKIIGLAINVHSNLGPGLLEKCYVNALAIELTQAGLPFVKQKEYKVFYKGLQVGQYFADLVVDNKIILEVKACKELNALMEAQLLNYLVISKIEVGYLLNFNSTSLIWKRRIRGDH